MVVGWLVYILGFPLLIFFLLYGRLEVRSALLAGKAGALPGMKKYAFISYGVYNPHVAPWFESVDMLRRMTLCGLIAFMGPADAGSEYYVAVRATCGMLLSLIIAAFYREVMPYRRSYLNTMMAIGGYCILFTYALAFIIVVKPWGEMDDNQLSVAGWILVMLALPIVGAAGVRMLIELNQQLGLERHRQRLEDRVRTHVKKLSAIEHARLKEFEDSTLNVVCAIRTLTAANREALLGVPALAPPELARWSSSKMEARASVPSRGEQVEHPGITSGRTQPSSRSQRALFGSGSVLKGSGKGVFGGRTKRAMVANKLPPPLRLQIPSQPSPPASPPDSPDTSSLDEVHVDVEGASVSDVPFLSEEEAVLEVSNAVPAGLEVVGVKFYAAGVPGDFQWEIQNGKHPQALYIFNDNAADHGTGVAGGGNAVIRPYSSGPGALAAGISTGETTASGGYKQLDERARRQIDSDFEELVAKLQTGRFSQVRYSSEGQGGRLGTGIFRVAPEVIDYITAKLKSLGTYKDGDEDTQSAAHSGDPTVSAPQLQEMSFASAARAHDDVVAKESVPGAPLFPKDLFDSNEPILLMKRGNLVQVTTKRRDGWWYGFVLPTYLDQHSASSTAVARGSADLDKEDGGAGWFPQAYVAPADKKRMHQLQVTLSRKLDEANSVITEGEVKLKEDAARLADEAKREADARVAAAQAEADRLAREAAHAAAAVREQATRDSKAAEAKVQALEAEATHALAAAKKAEQESIAAQHNAQLEIDRIRSDSSVDPPSYWTPAGKIPPNFANAGGQHKGKQYYRTVIVREGTNEYKEACAAPPLPANEAGRLLADGLHAGPCTLTPHPPLLNHIFASQVVQAFEKTSNGKRVIKLERVQNVALWQTYSMWLMQMRHREEDRRRQGLQAVPAAQCEKYWLWHGTHPDALSKIVAQGFNRSFAGKNAVVYGRGVYFARGKREERTRESGAREPTDFLRTPFLCVRHTCAPTCSGC